MKPIWRFVTLVVTLVLVVAVYALSRGYTEPLLLLFVVGLRVTVAAALGIASGILLKVLGLLVRRRGPDFSQSVAAASLCWGVILILASALR